MRAHESNARSSRDRGNDEHLGQGLARVRVEETRGGSLHGVSIVPVEREASAVQQPRAHEKYVTGPESANVLVRRPNGSRLRCGRTGTTLPPGRPPDG